MIKIYYFCFQLEHVKRFARICFSETETFEELERVAQPEAEEVGQVGRPLPLAPDFGRTRRRRRSVSAGKHRQSGHRTSHEISCQR